MIIELRNDPDQFRKATRSWIADTLPSNWADRIVAEGERGIVAVDQWWMTELHKEGLAIPHWPAAYGGHDLDLPGQVILADELARAGAPFLHTYVVSLNHMPGTLIPFGSEEQKRKYLPEISQGAIWCQGFSEPGAGSDLASLRTRAVRDGDHYVVNGQKIWSSMSRFADHCILLVRTDPEAKKHAGITFLLMDMNTPGLEVRPIRQINGDSEFSELFLTDVRIPLSNRVGEENRGWQVTQATLSSERGILWFNYSERWRYAVEAYYRESLASGAAWLDDAELRREFLMRLAELQAGRHLVRQILRENAHDGAPSTSYLAALIKLTESTLHQRIGDLLVRIEGLDGQRRVAGAGATRLIAMYEYMTTFGFTISAGTNEIMRNLIAERGLGMPKG